MKHVILTALFIVHALLVISQSRLVKELDGDLKYDTVYLDESNSTIVCRLSTQGFKQLRSGTIEDINEQSSVRATKNGFEFSLSWMRAGGSSQFRYDKPTQKIQLIGMNRYELGNAANDGSGESSVNMLTNDYIGKWNYFDEKKERLIPIPPIKTKMILPKTYLQTFSDKIFFDYQDQCSALFYKSKEAAQKKH